MSQIRPSPSAGELDCLVILWESAEDGFEALRLSDVRQRMIDRREKMGEPGPAVSTVSTYLRGGVAKGLLEEVRINTSGKVVATSRSRGVMRSTRSPRTAYRAAVTPQEVFRHTILAIAEAYPRSKRLFLLVDVARELGIPDRTISQLDEWVRKRLNGQNPTGAT